MKPATYENDLLQGVVLESTDPYLVLIETFSVSRDRFGEHPEVVAEALCHCVEVRASLCGRAGDFLPQLAFEFSANLSKMAVHLLAQPPNV